MSRMVKVVTLEEMAAYPAAEPVRLSTAVDLESNRADAHWGLLQNDQLVARCSLWWKETPRHLGQQVGFVGHYATADGAAAAHLITHACQKLQEKGCSLAVAPIDGSTWRSYRFVTEFGTEPRFLFEPDHPADWPDHFRACGFETFARYFSALNTDLTFENPELQDIANDLRQRGVVIRPIDETRFEEELHNIYRVATHAFRQHLLFTQIAEEEFAHYYHQLRTWLPLNLTLIGDRRGELVGFVFAVPDLLQRQRGELVTTVVVKSIAILPNPNLWGLGQLLLERVHQLARRQGLHRAIYALERDSPPVRKRSAIYARPFRNYALFSKVLRA